MIFNDAHDKCMCCSNVVKTESGQAIRTQVNILGSLLLFLLSFSLSFREEAQVVNKSYQLEIINIGATTPK